MSEEEQICCICQDEDDHDPLVKSPNCRCREAVYHRKCVDEYIEKRPFTYTKPGCPMCRKEFLTKEKVVYKLNVPVLYMYSLVIVLSLIMEYFLPSSTILYFFTQLGFMLLLVTAIYHKEIIDSFFEFVGARAEL